MGVPKKSLDHRNQEEEKLSILIGKNDRLSAISGPALSSRKSITE